MKDRSHRLREAHALALQVTGVKQGEQLAQVGCVDGGLMAAKICAGHAITDAASAATASVHDIGANRG